MSDLGSPVAIVLAGGSSSRFWPLGDKSLIPFLGRPLLELHLRELRAVGFEQFVVVANPENEEAIRILLANQVGLAASVAVQAEPVGMGDALLAAEEALAPWGPGTPIYVTQAHDIVDASLHRAMLERARTGAAGGPAGAWVAAQEVDAHFPGGYLVVEGERVRGVVEKPPPGQEPSRLVNIVAHLYRDWAPLFRHLARLKSQGAPAEGHYEMAMSALMLGEDVRVCRYTGPWQPLKYPWHVLQAMDLLLERLKAGWGREVLGEDLTETAPGVLMGEGVRLFPGAQVVGPAYIGEGAIIGTNSLVRGSMIGPRSVVGFSSEVARSYVGADCWLHTNYVGDSVLAEDVSLGSGTVTGNLRFDEKPVKSLVRDEVIDTGLVKLGVVFGRGARTGINASVMPGVKVGRYAAVGPGVLLGRDLPDGVMAAAEQTLRYSPSPTLGGTADRSAFRGQLSAAPGAPDQA